MGKWKNLQEYKAVKVLNNQSHVPMLSGFSLFSHFIFPIPQFHFTDFQCLFGKELQPHHIPFSIFSVTKGYWWPTIPSIQCRGKSQWSRICSIFESYKSCFLPEIHQPTYIMLLWENILKGSGRSASIS